MLEVSFDDIYRLRDIWNIKFLYKMVDICGGEFEVLFFYYYLMYE